MESFLNIIYPALDQSDHSSTASGDKELEYLENSNMNIS